jgi:hydrogenase nickel incorporation protein HypA/HybF
MHELGVIVEVVKQVEQVKLENNLTEVDTIVLAIGQLSAMIPKYVEEVFPVAIDNTSLKDTKLKIEILPAIAKCNDCSKEFNLVESKGQCPLCDSKSYELISGREFIIKEIIAY